MANKGSDQPQSRARWVAQEFRGQGGDRHEYFPESLDLDLVKEEKRDTFVELPDDVLAGLRASRVGKLRKHCMALHQHLRHRVMSCSSPPGASHLGRGGRCLVPVISRPLWEIWQGSEEQARGHRCGWLLGVPLGMGGDPEPCTERYGQHTSLWGSARTSRTPCHRVQLLDLGPRWKLLLVQEWTQPTHRWLRRWSLLKTHRTVHRAAGCVCCDCYTYMQQLFIEKPLMEKKQN